MPPPRFPSRIEPLSFPVFGISWFSEPSEGGRSIYAYCGGGGSAKTGVNNSVVIFGERNGPRQINTGDNVGIVPKIYQNPISGKLWLLVALGCEVRRYPIDVEDTPEGDESTDDPDQSQVIHMGEESCVTVTANSMASQIALGCESGRVMIFDTTDEKFTTGEKPLSEFSNHTKSVCALDYASGTIGRLISSAKDGTAVIYDDGQVIAGMRCSVTDPSQPKNAPPAKQILVRGCAFADTKGKLCYTVASARRGKAFLAQWEETVDEKTGNKKFVCRSKTAASTCPISAMSLSADLSLLVLGSVEGDIIMWGVQKWKAIKVFREVHHLPVTCIAARPFYSIPGFLRGEEEDGVMIHAISASADSQLGCLTAQRSGRRKKSQSNNDDGPSFFSCSNLMALIYRLLILWIISLIFAPVVQEAKEKCSHVLNQEAINDLPECILNEVLYAPSWTPGITSPPY
mmetsp:Transcript_8537/g.11268  ORF Transcript_8537/g.11268 Transcript_8537/m.11268 type:complete len:458 (-) Transcript_8537:234-1607(-)